mmetsp:Transcript_100677/g.197616  ORF Transcript_100677/g.197616 Transcript_100677/m.197616 type:complete len:232 (+) Transcript_100677:71-766(+)
MGKYAKKQKIQKIKGTNNGGMKKSKKGKKSAAASRDNGVKKGKSGQKRKAKAASKRHAAAIREARQVADAQTAAAEQPAAGGDVNMDGGGGAGANAVGGETGQEAAKLVSFLARARTENKAMEALKKALNVGHSSEALGAALTHLAGRGLAAGVRALLERGAPTNVQDHTQPPGRTTPMQLAASRGHVNVVRVLAEAGADRTGALEASQDLAKLGAVFAEEKRAIQAVLGR